MEALVHVIRTEAVRRADWELLANRMPKRFEKAMRYRLERDRLLCLGAGLLMMDALGVQDEREIAYGPFGKPSVPGMQAFNISHSGSTCVLACGPAECIGVDVEEIDERHVDIAQEVFTENELAWMEQDPTERFFQLWTWKESVMKATGLGMRLAPRSFEVLPFAYGKTARVMGQDWHAWTTRLADARLSVCADAPLSRVRIIEA